MTVTIRTTVPIPHEFTGTGQVNLEFRGDGYLDLIDKVEKSAKLLEQWAKQCRREARQEVEPA